MLSYAFKRVIRSWKLFAALLLGTVLASTFFAGINIGADTTAKQALDQRLSTLLVDMVVSYGYGYYELSIPEETSYLLSSSNVTEAVETILSVKDVDQTEAISRCYQEMFLNSDRMIPFMLIGVSDNSRVREGLTVTEGRNSLQENETYVWVGSSGFGDLEVDDVLQINSTIWLWNEKTMNETVVTLAMDLTVAGFVQLSDEALKIAIGDYYEYSWFPGPSPRPLVTSEAYLPEDNLLIVDWGNTSAKLIDAYYDLAAPYSPVSTEILVYVEESMVNPWDVGESIERVTALASQINGRVEKYNMGISDWDNYLNNVLNSYQSDASLMRIVFIATSIPVFFLAWYLGGTVSDVSFNLRRREIGLLLTKGFSTRQLLRLFLGEAVLIGLIGGLIGTGLSLLLTPFFVSAIGGQLGAPMIGPGTVIAVVVFSIAITLLSVFWSARRAARLHSVDALKEYRYVEDVKPYKSKWPWIALLLGGYKVSMFLLGVDLYTLMLSMSFGVFGIFLGIWAFFDVIVLGYGISFGFMSIPGLGLGPILFFWGLTKILIRGSMKFQELTTKAAKFLGDLGALATKNVSRNPARVASIAFLIALIIGYSFYATGAYASERDYVIRGIKFNVGADISVHLTTLVNASKTMSTIEELDGVASTVLEYSLYGTSSAGSMSLKAVDPEKWPEIAYYEDELFTGNDVAAAFQQMMEDNETIILDRWIADYLKFNIGEEIAVTLGEESYNLEIVGIFGPERIDGTFRIEIWGGYYWSYIPEGLYYAVNDTVSASGRILVKLESGANGKTVAEDIRNLNSDFGVVYSVDEQLEAMESNLVYVGRMNIQRLGVIFAVLAASVGTALVTLVSLRERSKEVSIMSVRGLSFKQSTVMLLVENLAVIVFAMILGTVVGLIIVRGNVAAANSVPVYLASSSMISHRMVFPLDSILILVLCFTLIFASTIIPVIVMARRYVSRLERMVREA